MTQVDVAERIGVRRSVISRLWKTFRESGSPAEQHPRRGCRTTPAQDRF